MERWIADVLSGVPVEEYFNVLTREISAVFAQLRRSERIPQAFLATGFASLEPGGQLHPMNVVISNSIDDEGNFSEKALQREFIVYMEPLGNRRQLVRSVGWWMPAQVRQILEHKIRVVARADPSNPERAAGPLLYALRETAKDSQESVGKAALLASLPRCAVPSPGVVTGPMDNLDFRRQAVSLYLPDKVKNPHDAATYVPALIGPRLMAVGLKVRPGTEPPVMNSRDGY